MLLLVTGLLLQTPVTATIQHDCPPDAEACARVYANWKPDHSFPQPDFQSSSEAGTGDQASSIPHRVYRQRILGRIDGGAPSALDLIYEAGEAALECNDFGNTDT